MVGRRTSNQHRYILSSKLCVCVTLNTHFQSGHKWRSHRKLIAPTFHLNVLKSFIDLFNENSRQVVQKLNTEVGKTFDAHDYMSEATVEILLGKYVVLFYKTFVHNSLYDFVFSIYLVTFGYEKYLFCNFFV